MEAGTTRAGVCDAVPQSQAMRGLCRVSAPLFGFANRWQHKWCAALVAVGTHGEVDLAFHCALAEILCNPEDGIGCTLRDLLEII